MSNDEVFKYVVGTIAALASIKALSEWVEKKSEKQKQKAAEEARLADQVKALKDQWDTTTKKIGEPVEMLAKVDNAHKALADVKDQLSDVKESVSEHTKLLQEHETTIAVHEEKIDKLEALNPVQTPRGGRKK